jgi:prepilin-type N-terminal cleavage/methylation domain-containing protein
MPRSSHAAPRPLHLRGFTLVEAVIVVSIVGVLAAISLPKISDMAAKSNETLDMAKIESLLHEARTFARRTNQCVEVTITNGSAETATPYVPAKITYQTIADSTVTAYGQPLCPPVTAITPMPGLTLSRGIQLSDFTLDSTTGKKARFLRYGGMTYQAPVTFRVSNARSGLNRKVSIFPGAGTTRVGGT